MDVKRELAENFYSFLLQHLRPRNRNFSKKIILHHDDVTLTIVNPRDDRPVLVYEKTGRLAASRKRTLRRFYQTMGPAHYDVWNLGRRYGDERYDYVTMIDEVDDDGMHFFGFGVDLDLENQQTILLLQDVLQDFPYKMPFRVDNKKFWIDGPYIFTDAEEQRWQSMSPRRLWTTLIGTGAAEGWGRH